MPIGGGYNWTLPLLQQINRQGDIMMYADEARRRQEQSNEASAFHRLGLLFKQAELSQRQQQEAEKAKTSALMDMYKTASDAGDTETLGRLAPEVGRIAGIDLSGVTPRPKPDKDRDPSSEMGVLYRMSGGDPVKFQSLYSALEERKQAAAARFRSPRENAIKGLEELAVQQYLGGKDPGPVLDLLRQVNESKRAPGEGAEAKSLRQTESDIISLTKQLNSIQAGVGITDTVTPEGRPTAIKNLQRQLSVLHDKYRSMGGDPARIGIEPGPGRADDSDPLGIRRK